MMLHKNVSHGNFFVGALVILACGAGDWRCFSLFSAVRRSKFLFGWFGLMYRGFGSWAELEREGVLKNRAQVGSFRRLQF